MEPKNLLTKMFEAALMFASAAFLIRVAVGWIMEIWPVLAIIAGIVLACIIAWRVYVHFRNGGKW